MTVVAVVKWSKAASLSVSESGPPQHPAAGAGQRRPAGQVLHRVCGRLQRGHWTHLQVSSPLLMLFPWPFS